MALVDWEAVVLDLQAVVRSKASHGRRDLTDAIADSIESHRQVEGLAEKALRLYGDDLADALAAQPATSVPAGNNGNGNGADPSKTPD